jgi:hypothetical protein
MIGCTVARQFIGVPSTVPHIVARYIAAMIEERPAAARDVIRDMDQRVTLRQLSNVANAMPRRQTLETLLLLLAWGRGARSGSPEQRWTQ